jgi:hypothetical protein
VVPALLVLSAATTGAFGPMVPGWPVCELDKLGEGGFTPLLESVEDWDLFFLDPGIVELGRLDQNGVSEIVSVVDKERSIKLE